ncbi:putative calcium-binding mitochondrial carrier SAL1 [Cutaneotrichosporon oleaginosum]|uniref:Putative calcium-binding mitochondrial carrier SAL1 n=1 Tax=Cutaneotrichosporon oleaginosum TaxID=879819 RepID=A0A0J0XBW2_9TREE|nr:putative calcium-binding mitochondrial carrier SAL1 [Cutaneotrichosporon oleaginosum]KLT38561.1 putative calcium-binding mitochondrial carrier SAL1 [Cutaneotrichosporon oleaginosum]TXT08483.1 hypothetical protein COLE_05407 [Cutaneotrichosporon oleaginosum]
MSAPSPAPPGPSAPPHHPTQPQPSSAPHGRPHYPLQPSGEEGEETSLREPPGADLYPHRGSLADFRAAEGAAARAAKLRSIWAQLPKLPDVDPDHPTEAQRMRLPGQDTLDTLSPERADRLRTLYTEELVKQCGEDRPDARLWGGADDLEPYEAAQKGVSWKAFRKFLWDQERQLWDEFQALDRNGDGVLDAEEMRSALEHQGVELSQNAVSDLVRLLSGTPDQEHVTFTEFRDFLLLLPRRATPFEIYKFYQVHKRFSDGRGAARVNMDGDPILSFPKAPGGPEHSTAQGFFRPHDHDDPQDDLEDTLDVLGDEDEDYYEPETRHEAWRFLLAGGIAGSVSRSVTAPFDRLKVYLMTMNIPQTPGKPTPWRAAHNLMTAVRAIYQEGAGIRAFWVGNGLNVIKIFPESAIKFVSYEQSKRFLAKYWDGVHDPAEISSSSRFIAGGIGGITSQLAIYGLETLKTRVQSNIGPSKGWRSVQQTANYMWREGGFRPFYRGLGLGLIGVFPYSAIDMGTYETLKTAYCRSFHVDEPPVYAVLSFGALSGSIGAASVYPINLLRTRLQASGSTGHPQHYTGFMDVLHQTLRNEGWRGLYKGLLPSILKVGPAVGVSWIVYEDAKRRLGV